MWLLYLCQFLMRELEADHGILVVVALQTDGIVRTVIEGNAIQGQRHQLVPCQVVHCLYAPVHLVVLALAVAVLGPHEASKGMLEPERRSPRTA